ncbi:MAG: hypothetical protein WAU32_10965 [Thermoanaerobaculia bacterium]
MRNAVRRFPIVASLAAAVFVLAALLYLRGAAHADPGVVAAREDLDLVRNWIASGRISDLVEDPSHLPKPGYLAYLRAALPHGGSDAFENRRFLLSNAIWILLGIGAAALALGRQFGPPSAIFFLLAVLACVTLRDSADYVASEPVASGLALLVAAGAIRESPGGGSLRGKFLIGCTTALVALVRPNLGLLLLAILILTGLMPPRRKGAAVAALGGFILCLAVGSVVGRAARVPLKPFGAGSSRVLLWGTADYYWKPDVGGWPVGSTPEETNRLQLQKARARWGAFFQDWNANRARSLAWRLGHALLSTDELPSRWMSPRYLRADKLGRAWWWAIAACLTGGALAAAVGGTNEWRFVPLLVLAACAVQSLVFGADPRLALPFLPILAVGLAAVLPTARWDRWALGSAFAVVVVVLLLVHKVPDVATYDFVLVRGPHRHIAQQVPSSALPKGGPSAVHFRLLQEQPCLLGISAYSGGRLLLRREPADSSPWPAVFSLALTEQETAQARREGLELWIETDGPDSSSDAFVYYPVIPTLLRGRSNVDGQDHPPSGFGGEAIGSLPLWVTAN